MNITPVFRRSPFGLVALALLAGCSSYEVKVDAIARAPVPAASTASGAIIGMPAASSYWIRCRNPEIAADDLRFKEAARHVRTALSAHGLWLAPDVEHADLLVDLDCGISGPKIVEQPVGVPVLGTAGTPPDLGPLNQSPDGTVRIRPVGGASFDVVDYEDGTLNITVYEKRLAVTCRENRPAEAGKPPLELWSVSVSIENESKDLRGCLPALAAAVMLKIGVTTDGEVTDRLPKSGDAVGFVNAGM